MVGSLGRCARELLPGAVGARSHARERRTATPPTDIVTQAIEQAAGSNGLSGGARGSAADADGQAGAASRTTTIGVGTEPPRDGPDAATSLRRELEAALSTIFTSASDAIVT